jgi:tRNA-2-methylthio-N6-dimethylallyladenosine synthase
MTRTYSVETYGCQMNVHDSERIAGLLDEAGLIPALFAKMLITNCMEI